MKPLLAAVAAAALLPAFLLAAPPKASGDGPVLFVGSSSVHKWTTLARDFPDLATVNLGVDGYELPDCVRRLYASLPRYPNPRRIVLYAGENDVAAGASPETVLARFQTFVRKARGAAPGVPIVFVSIKPSPARRAYSARFERANELVRGFIESGREQGLDYVDVYSRMVDERDRPRAELFSPDQLHMGRCGYVLWASLIAPVIGSSGPAAASIPRECRAAD